VKQIPFLEANRFIVQEFVWQVSY